MCAIKRLTEKERKKEIMDSAMQLILQKGLDNTTMEDVIAGTSLSKGGVYHYYGSVLEIFKDIMAVGIEYRNAIIKEKLGECVDEKRFMAKQLTDKILDENPYVPIYIEFLISQKRNPQLKSMMTDLQEMTMERFQKVMPNATDWVFDQRLVSFTVDFVNALTLAVNILDARDSFHKNRAMIEQMLLLIFEKTEKVRVVENEETVKGSETEK